MCSRSDRLDRKILAPEPDRAGYAEHAVNSQPGVNRSERVSGFLMQRNITLLEGVRRTQILRPTDATDICQPYKRM
jgi:hypothetical protein